MSAGGHLGTVGRGDTQSLQHQRPPPAQIPAPPPCRPHAAAQAEPTTQAPAGPPSGEKAPPRPMSEGGPHDPHALSAPIVNPRDTGQLLLHTSYHSCSEATLFCLLPSFLRP